MRLGKGHFLTRLLLLVGACWLLAAAMVQPASAAAGLAVEKYAYTDYCIDSTEVAQVGDTIYYDIYIYNTGDVQLTNITVQDSLLGNLTKKIFGKTPTLAPYGEVYYQVLYKVKATDPDPVTNVLTVTAKPKGSAKILTAKAQTITDVIHPKIEVTKTADREYASLGDLIFYTITVKNTGDVTLYDLKVKDDLLGNVKFDSKELPKGDSETTTVVYEVTESDVFGPLTNTVTACATPFEEDDIYTLVDGERPTVCDDDSAIVNITPIGLFKTGDRIIARPGDVITYSITITNNSTKKLNNITVVDTLLGDLSGSFSDSLKAGDSETEDFTYTVKPTDPNPLVNIVTVTGTLGTSSKVYTNIYKNEIELVYPGLQVTKTADVTCASIGDTVTYTITLKNTGKVPLKIKEVSDTLLGDITDLFPATLPVGATISNDTLTYAVTESDPNPLTNVVTVNAKADDLPGYITESATASVDICGEEAAAGIAVSKEADVTSASVGQTVHYTITVTNVGEEDLSDVTVVDTLLGILDFSDTLAAGQSETITVPYTVKANDVSPLVNTVTVSGFAPEASEPVTASDSASIIIEKNAGIAVSKIADRGSANVGKTVKYTITITNTGNVTLNNITVTDTLLGNLSASFGDSLAPGASETKCFPYTVKATDANPLLNTVTVTGTPQDKTYTVTASDTAVVPRCSAGGGSEPGQQDYPDMMIYNAASANIKGANVYNITGVNQMQCQSIVKGSSIIFPLRFENDTLNPATILITGEGSGSGWTVQYFDAKNKGKDITNLVTNGGWNPSCDVSGLLAPFGARDFIVVITPSSSGIASGTVKNFTIKATMDGTVADVVIASVTVK